MCITDWTTRAACKGTDPDELFVQGAAQNRAKLICRGCPVRTEGLAARARSYRPPRRTRSGCLVATHPVRAGERRTRRQLSTQPDHTVVMPPPAVVVTAAAGCHWV